MSDFRDDPNFMRHEMHDYDSRVQWAAVAVILLLVGGSCGPAITGGLTSQLPGLVGADRAPRAFGLDSLFYNLAQISSTTVTLLLISSGLGGAASASYATTPYEWL